ERPRAGRGRLRARADAARPAVDAVVRGRLRLVGASPGPVRLERAALRPRRPPLYARPRPHRPRPRLRGLAPAIPRPRVLPAPRQPERHRPQPARFRPPATGVRRLRPRAGPALGAERLRPGRAVAGLRGAPPGTVAGRGSRRPTGVVGSSAVRLSAGAGRP